MTFFAFLKKVRNLENFKCNAERKLKMLAVAPF